MRGPGEILLLSTYALGRPPHALASSAAFLERAGFSPACLDLAVEPFDPARVERARLLAFSVPMHTALLLGLRAARRARAAAPSARLAFFGLYAPLNAELLESAGAVAILGGEFEAELVALSEALERGEEDLARFRHRGPQGLPTRRLDSPAPSREGLPPLTRYARLDPAGGPTRVAGYTEASRGCKHLCLHCPIPPLYRGRFVAVPIETVLADVAGQVAAGAEHLTFGDPDFLNGPTHALRLARAVKARFPGLTFDFTAKVEHLLRHAGALAELVACGALFVTSAVESLSDKVLSRLRKGHSRDDALRAFELCALAGLTLRPSLLPFTPFSTLEDLLDLLETFEARGLFAHLDPVQLSIRLLIPPGSLLEGAPDIAFEGLDRDALSWRWRHPDPRMDELQPRIAAAAELSAAQGEDPIETIRRIHERVRATSGLPRRRVRGRGLAPRQRRVPRLTESWFC